MAEIKFEKYTIDKNLLNELYSVFDRDNERYLAVDLTWENACIIKNGLNKLEKIKEIIKIG